MADFDVLRDAALVQFAELIQVADRAEAVETKRRLMAARARLADGKLTVVVCGEFNRGKSTLLNALLGEPDLFPTDDFYTTNLVTRVAHGPVERITVRMDDGPDQEIDRARLADYVTETGNPGNAKGVLDVSIELPNPRLGSGLVLMDTPGVGGVYSAHTAATDSVLALAQALLFVTDIEILTASELAFLRRAARSARALDDPDAILVVLTKTDLVADHDAVLADTRGKIARATGRQPEQVTVVPVSSRLRLRALRDGTGDQDTGNFGELEQLLWSRLMRRQADLLLGEALAALDESSLALLEPIEAEAESLRTRAEDAAENLRAALVARRARLTALASGDADWTADLKREVLRIANEVKLLAQDDIDALRRRTEADRLGDKRLRNDHDALVEELGRDVVEVLAAAAKRLDDGTARLQQEFSERNDLQVGRSHVDSLPAPPVPPLKVREPAAKDRNGATTQGWVERHKHAQALGLAGGRGGQVIAGLLLPIPGVSEWIGLAVGTALGGLVGNLLDQRAGTAAEQRQLLLEGIDLWLQQQRTYAQLAIDAAADDFSDALVVELRSRIVQARDSAEGAVLRARRASRRSAVEARTREAELAAERAPVARVRAQVTALTEALVGLRGSGAEGDSAGVRAGGQA
ncbi:GTPase SAR1 family protein [Streptomyces sp. 846.5]|nr:dynamin family protein [Streptomyces sp. 846.5]TDT97636.1 GTPase SAR1 family protein [Streptomyces sp. 846.5]